MPFEIITGDITQVRCDAIVNAANSSLLGGGGVDGAIHHAAGPGLLEECRTLGGCGTGEAKATRGYDLPCKYVIHTVGPVWQGGGLGEEELLRSCYRNSLNEAVARDCESVAFPLISSGIFGYPREDAYRVACDEITKFLDTHELLVYLVIYRYGPSLALSSAYDGLREYIRKKYRDPFPCVMASCGSSGPPKKARPRKEKKARTPEPEISMADFCCEAAAAPAPAGAAELPGLDERLRTLDESFQEMLLRKIDESGMTDAECYKKANIDRKLFSKIRSNPQYKPTKNTALAFAIALRLPKREVDEMLKKAGFALSDSSKSDVIISYYLENGVYDIYEINDALFHFDQGLLGCPRQ